MDDKWGEESGKRIQGYDGLWMTHPRTGKAVIIDRVSLGHLDDGDGYLLDVTATYMVTPEQTILWCDVSTYWLEFWIDRERGVNQVLTQKAMKSIRNPVHEF